MENTGRHGTFLWGSSSGNELKLHVMPNIQILNDNYGHFIDYILSDFAKEVLAKLKKRKFI